MNPRTPGSIQRLINKDSRARLDKLELFAEIGSTNSYLLGAPCPAPGRCRVALAEHQTKGRGRRDRVWVSPPSTGLCLSIAYTFAAMPRDLPSLSLAVGIGIAQALERLGIEGIGLKWPNDIVARNGKLGGVLSEVHPARGDGLTIVVGVGLNIDFADCERGFEIAAALERATDLASCCEQLPSRLRLSAAVIEALIVTMVRFEAAGFAEFHASWPKFDWLRGRAVTIEMTRATSAGIAQGVDTDGALLLKADGAMQRVTSGSVILRQRTGTHP